MTTVAEPTVTDSVPVEDGTSQVAASNHQDTKMHANKVEDTLENVNSDLASGQNRQTALNDDLDADGDSEAETLIQSPEKRRAQAEAAASQSTNQATAKEVSERKDDVPDSGKKSRKRKRGGDAEYENSSKASSPQSSPLSSPAIHAHSRDSDSDLSNASAPKSAKVQRSTRNTAPKAESENAEGNMRAKARRRRPSDILPPSSKHGHKGSVDAGGSERRETRSATYPRHSSDDRSPSPRPSSRRDHRRGISTQLTGDFERKKRGRPPLINTRRNKSVDRSRSSSDDSSSPSRTRPGLPKFSSLDQDTMSPAKVSGPRKWRDKNGRTFLSRACNNDDLERARVCHKERPEDLNLPDNAGNSPLQIASLEGFADIVKFLLEQGAEVDTRNIDKETPLIDAVENGHLEVVKLLLAFGANPRLGNAKGDEPFELVPQEDPNYKIVRKLIADAKEQDFSKRRRSHDNSKTEAKEDQERGSSRAASAPSPRDSPPILGPRSPPAANSRRRTGRSESTRNDLLWQANTPENLRLLAAKGNVQGVIYVLNILQKAEPEAVIAAAKAGHEEVLQYLLAMGDADPDPDPVIELKAGFNTPMLAAIGRGHLDVIKLLVEQTGFNPTRKWRGKTYFEVSADRKGANWQKEHEILKSAYEKYGSGKQRKTSSPRKTRDQDRMKEKKTRRSVSPSAISSNLRHSSSPSLTHKSLPEKSSPKSASKEKKPGPLSPQRQERRKASASARDASDSVAVASDQEQTVADKKGHRHRRSQSDLPVPANLEAELAHRRRRLVTGKEHRRRKSAVTAVTSGEGSEVDVDVDVKRERDAATPGLKRPRSSVSPGPQQTKDIDTDRITVKKRRTVQESSPEEIRPSARKKSEPQAEAVDTEMKDASSNKVLTQVDEIFKQRSKRSSQGRASRSTSPAPATGNKAQTSESIQQQEPVVDPATEVSKAKSPSPEPIPIVDEVAEKAKVEAERRKTEEEQQAAAEASRIEAEQLAVQKAVEEKEAAERALAEKEAAEKAEAERRIAEEAAARQKAEEEAMARKREEEERQERIKRELEDTKRRQEEQIRQQHLEIERRRREALPAGLAQASLLLETNDPAYAQWLTRFLPLFTVRTEHLEPNCSPFVAQDLWVPNWQVAVLLGTKDLNLRNYTSFEKHEATSDHRDRMWRVGRFMLSYDFWTNGYNTPVKMAVDIERRERPKFAAMAELFWVKLSDFQDQIIRHPHLSGLQLKQQSICLRPQRDIIAEGEAKERALLSKQQPNGILSPTSGLVNGIHTSPPLTMFGSGGPRY